MDWNSSEHVVLGLETSARINGWSTPPLPCVPTQSSVITPAREHFDECKLVANSKLWYIWAITVLLCYWSTSISQIIWLVVFTTTILRVFHFFLPTIRSARSVRATMLPWVVNSGFCFLFVNLVFGFGLDYTIISTPVHLVLLCFSLVHVN